MAENPIRIMDFRGTYKGGGGPDKTILNSAALHDPLKIDVLVTYLRDPADTEYSIDIWAKRLGIKYVDVPDAQLFDIKCLKKLSDIISEHDIQLIHSHDDKTLLYGWLLKKKFPGIRIMYTCHSHASYGRSDFNSFLSYIRFIIRSKIQIFLMKKYEHPILTISHHTKDSLVSDGLCDNDVEVLVNGINLEEWKRNHGKQIIRKELFIDNETLLIGTVARIAQQDKDLDTFYKIAADITDKYENVKFVIVGEGYGDLLRREEKKVKSMGLSEKLFFTGHRTDLLDIYSSFDVFLMTSRSEGMPNTILEAMAMEVPVVSTRVGGVPEIIVNNSMGLLAPIGDVEALSQCLRLLLDDPARRRQIALAGRKRIEEEFSFAHRVRMMEKYYEQFVSD